MYALVFRPLRRSPVLARVVASLGLLLYLQEIVRLRFPVAGSGVATRRPVLPEDPIRLAGTAVSQNRLLLVALVVVSTVALAALYRFTRFGLATRAAAGNEKGALLLGISPDRLGAVNWAMASVLAGLAVILIEPIAGLDPTTTTLLVIPALAAALLGRLISFGVAAAAGLGIGMLQSLILGYGVQPEASWIPDWLPTTGLQQAVPVVLIVGALVWGGTRCRTARRSSPDTCRRRRHPDTSCGGPRPGRGHWWGCSPSLPATDRRSSSRWSSRSLRCRSWSSPATSGRSRWRSWPSPGCRVSR